MIKCVDKTKLDFQIRRLLEQTTGDNVVEVLKETVPTYRPNRINC